MIHPTLPQPLAHPPAFLITSYSRAPMKVSVTVNGKPHTDTGEPRRLRIQYVRVLLGYTGAIAAAISRIS